MTRAGICAILIWLSVVIGALPAQARGELSVLVEECAAADLDPRETLNFCQRALATGKLSIGAAAQVRTNLGIAFFELAQYADARAELTRAIAVLPDLTLAYLYRARSLAAVGQLQAAANDFATVLQRDPNAWQAYYARGEMLLAHGDPAGAEQDFTSALRLERDLPDAHFGRGAARYALGMWQGAAEDFTVVLRANPRDAAAYLNRAQARAAGGDTGATADYDQALQLAPEWSRAWFARGAYYESLGDRERANRDFMRAYELGYDDPWLNERVRRIRG
ncbi:MAG: tetratricopeptide repeat protein [Pseudomonadota bacterium]